MSKNPNYDISRSVSLKDAITGGSQTRLDGFNDDVEDMINTQETLVLQKIPTEDLSRLSQFTFADEVGGRVTDYTHGIHNYPAKFIPQIPRWAFRFAELDNGDTVYDPFVGCGTTAVEGRLCGLNSYGTDISPLARMISEVKSNPILPSDPANLRNVSDNLVAGIREDDQEEILVEEENEYFTPVINWEFWFPEKSMKELTKIKRHIHNIGQYTDVTGDELELLKKYYLVNLSSVIIPASYQVESQIKVRKNENKFDDGLPDVFQLFENSINESQEGVIEFCKECRDDGLFVDITGEDARERNVPDNSVDLVITSPPYINAIDYTMAHRRSLLFLDFFTQDEFYDHRREYVGMTERAVTKEYYKDLQLTGFEDIDEKIELIFEKGERKDKIRAFILYQYFTGMRETFVRLSEALKSDSYCIMVVGDNEIRDEYIPTAEFLSTVAEDVGFTLEYSFKHLYKKVQLQIGRNSNAGKIDYETILIWKN